MIIIDKNILMKTLFIEKEIKYTGTQLSPHWIYKNFHIQGDTQ